LSITIFLLSLGLILLPFSHWEVQKVWMYLKFIEIFFIFSLVYLIKKRIFIESKNSKIFIVLFLFLTISVLSSLLGLDVSKSIFGNLYRSDGLITFFHLVAFSILIGAVYKDKWNTLIAVSIFLGGVISSIFDYFGQPNFLAGFILVSLSFGIYIFYKTNNKYVKTLIILGFIVQIYRMFLVGSYVGILGLVILYPLWKLTNKRKINKILILVIVGILSVFVSIWLNNLKSKKEYVAESRVRIYRNVFLGSLKRPVLGYGWANSDYAFESIVWPLKFNNDVYVDKVHMLFLEIFATTGILGLIAYLYFLFSLFKRLINKNNLWTRVLLTSFLMYLIYSQTNVTSISYEFIFWLIVGIILSL